MIKQVTYFDKQHPDRPEALIEVLAIASGHAGTLVDPVIKVIIEVLVLTVYIAFPLGDHLLQVKPFSKFSKCLLSLIQNPFITTLWDIKLPHNPYSTDCQDMVEAARVGGTPTEFLDVDLKLINHRVVGRCIVTGNTQYLS